MTIQDNPTLILIVIQNGKVFSAQLIHEVELAGF